MSGKFLIFVCGTILGLWALASAIRSRKDQGGEGRGAAADADRPSIAGSPPEPFASDDVSWRFAVPLTLAIVFALQLFFRSGLIFLQGGDEYCRANYAFDWALHPFFAPADHVWLAGHFYALGLAYRLLGSMPLAVTATSLLGVWATVVFGMALARRVWGSMTAGIFAGILIGSEWFQLWASANPYAEIFFHPAFLASLWAWVKAWQISEQRGISERAAAERYFLLAAACMGFGTMFRFEMWYPGILFGAFLGIRFLWFLTRSERRRLAWVPFLACILLAAYPLAWMIDNKIEMGSYFVFLNRYIELNRETNLFYDFSSVWTVILIYPKYLVADHWPRLALGGLGFLLIAAVGRRPRWASLLPVPAVLLFAMLITMRSGIGSNNRARFTEFLMLPFLCYGAGVLGYLWYTAPGWKRGLARTAVAAFVALAALHGVRYARVTYPHAWGVSPEFIQITQRLEREHDSSRPREGVVLIHPEDRTLAVYHGGNYLDYWMIRYHSPWPERVRELGTPENLKVFLETAPPGSRVLVRLPVPESQTFPGTKRLDTIGPYGLWERGP